MSILLMDQLTSATRHASCLLENKQRIWAHHLHTLALRVHPLCSVQTRAASPHAAILTRQARTAPR